MPMFASTMPATAAPLTTSEEEREGRQRDELVAATRKRRSRRLPEPDRAPVGGRRARGRPRALRPRVPAPNARARPRSAVNTSATQEETLRRDHVEELRSKGGRNGRRRAWRRTKMQHRRDRVAERSFEPEILASQGRDVGEVAGHPRASRCVARGSSRSGRGSRRGGWRTPVSSASSSVEQLRPLRCRVP